MRSGSPSPIVLSIPSHPLLRRSISLLLMAKKALSELTQAEVSLLNLSSKLLAVLQDMAEHPLLDTQQEYWKVKVKEDLVRPYFPVLIL